MGKVLDSRYRVLSRLGAGGIGVVYAAEHVRLQRKVAVKVLHPELSQNVEFRARFEREALAASKATHPSCVAVLDVGSVEGQPFLVMEYVEGERLSERVNDLTPAEAVEIGLQLLEALRHAHHHGIVHRDIKPDNVMLCRPDQAGTRIKLLDFGLAKNLTPGAPGSQTVTQYGTVFGTPSYMSPEQAAAAETDTRSDLYSLGVVLFQMACGRKPFVHEDPLDQVQAHLREAPPRARELRPELSAELERVIARALEKERARRFQSADEMIAALGQVPEAPGRAGPPPVPRVTATAREVEEDAPRKTPIATAATIYSPAARITRASAAPVRHIPSPLIIAALVLEGILGAIASWWLYPSPRSIAPSAEPSAQVEKTKPVANKTPGSPLTPAPRLPPPELRQAMVSLDRGDVARAEDYARKAAIRHKDGRADLLLGHIYFRKLWFSDGIKEYGKAVRRMPSLRSDATMQRNVINVLRRSDVAARAIGFLADTLGDAAIPALEKARDSHPDPDVRLNAARALAKLGR